MISDLFTATVVVVVVVVVVLVVLIAIKETPIENVIEEARELGLAQPLVFFHHPVDHGNEW
ncbi:hypothetical protein BHYA_0278g00010 [Botrytis hyacinthi]|uniref:Uncharacterized protein n=1 Tax=Botrytis hyacinthi TaxID=278943 RepID=A0A4Z1G7R2_9HELO|nr:hypothetical protein BHYA_0278g00010 [Botrytis hyacinthi]